MHCETLKLKISLFIIRQRVLKMTMCNKRLLWYTRYKS